MSRNGPVAAVGQDVGVSPARIPSTYASARAAFRTTAAAHGWVAQALAVDALGPDGETLTIDVTRRGPRQPRRALLVLSGVHGVEGFIGSALQRDLIERAAPPVDGDAILLVHAVNPWGMAWLRRQNEHNVDLNRNWARDTTPPMPNGPYDELHDLLCPRSLVMGEHDEFLSRIGGYVGRHGIEWVSDAISAGQYTHDDGMHFGGARTEQSTEVLSRVIADELAGAESVLVVDLHTGHGRYGTCTILTGGPVGSRNHEFLHASFAPELLEPTSGLAPGRLAAGLADVLPGSDLHSATVEFGTASGTRQLLASQEELWVHVHGDRREPDHAAAVDRYHRCFSPDDPAWEAGAMEQGRAILADAHRAAFPAS